MPSPSLTSGGSDPGAEVGLAAIHLKESENLSPGKRNGSGRVGPGGCRYVEMVFYIEKMVGSHRSQR